MLQGGIHKDDRPGTGGTFEGSEPLCESIWKIGLLYVVFSGVTVGLEDAQPDARSEGPSGYCLVSSPLFAWWSSHVSGISLLQPSRLTVYLMHLMVGCLGTT